MYTCDYFFVYLILVLLMVCIFIYLIYVTYVMEENKLKYIIGKMIYIIPFFDDVTKHNIYETILNFIMMLRNLSYCSGGSNGEKTIKMTDIIGIPINNPVMDWMDDIQYCDNDNGYVCDLYYDETIRPSKSVITLY